MDENVVILKWNPAFSSYTMYEFLVTIWRGELKGSWSVYEHESVRMGDRFFLVKVGYGNNGIVAAGRFTTFPYRDEDWSGRGREVYYADYKANVIINPETFPILTSDVLEEVVPDFDWRRGHSGVILPKEAGEAVLQRFDAFMLEHAKAFDEGLKKETANKQFRFCILKQTLNGLLKRATKRNTSAEKC